jgi:hypothetical protein
MDLQGISEADKYLLYGLLLKKRRSRGQERRVMAIIHGTLDLEGRIEALIRLQEEEDRALFVLPGPQAPRVGSAPESGQRDGSLLVVDAHPDVSRLLRKCSLKRRLSFHRIGESFDAVHLLRRLRTRLIVLNEILPPEDYTRYYAICRAIEPRIRIICLCQAPRGLDCSDAFRKNVRFLPKPINMERLEATAIELLESRG